MTQKRLRRYFAVHAPRLLTAACALAWVGCSADAASFEQVTSHGTELVSPIQENRSLAVTEKEIVSQFSLEEVLRQLLTQAQVA